MSSGTTSQTQLVVIANVPTTAGAVSLTGEVLTNLTTQNGAIAFDANGGLYVASGTTLTEINPNSGAVIGSVTMTNGASATWPAARCRAH